MTDTLLLSDLLESSAPQASSKDLCQTDILPCRLRSWDDDVKGDTISTDYKNIG